MNATTFLIRGTALLLMGTHTLIGHAQTDDGPLALARDLMVINVTKDDMVVRMAVVDEYVLPPDVTPAYVKAPRTDTKSPSEAILNGKWPGYTPPPMPQRPQ